MISIPGSIQIQFSNQSLWLLPDRAIWWPVESTLIVADVHFGKAASFRSAGVPVPSGATTKDLNRLSQLIDLTGAARLLILGDLLHARAGRQSEVFEPVAAWRRVHDQTRIYLIRGNHDRSAGRVPDEWNIQELDEPHREHDIAFTHFPDCPSDLPTIAGHVHPVTYLRDYDGSSVSVPCFVLDDRCLILPAFGTFTGGHPMQRQARRRMYLVAGKRIVAL